MAYPDQSLNIADDYSTSGIHMTGNLTVDGTITSTGYNMNVLQNPDEFREFIIWMCGVTDATDAPDEKAWMKVRNRVKEVAAQYVLARRDMEAERVLAQQRQEELYTQMEYQKSQQSIWQTSGTTTTSAGSGGNISLTGAGIAGSTALTAANALK